MQRNYQLDYNKKNVSFQQYYCQQLPCIIILGSHADKKIPDYSINIV